MHETKILVDLVAVNLAVPKKLLNRNFYKVVERRRVLCRHLLKRSSANIFQMK